MSKVRPSLLGHSRNISRYLHGLKHSSAGAHCAPLHLQRLELQQGSCTNHFSSSRQGSETAGAEASAPGRRRLAAIQELAEWRSMLLPHKPVDLLIAQPAPPDTLFFKYRFDSCVLWKRCCLFPASCAYAVPPCSGTMICP